MQRMTWCRTAGEGPHRLRRRQRWRSVISATKKVDFLLLETGMGGLEDATNVCSHPVCTIIASISMDHMHFLGNTLRDIYRQKLGILQKELPMCGVPACLRA